MAAERLKPKNEWEEHLETLRNLTPEQRKAYLARMLEEGQRQARGILGQRAKPNMTRDELKDMISRKYPGLSLSDQIIEDRKSYDDKILGKPSEPSSSKNLSIRESEGFGLPDTPAWVIEAFKKYGEPKISLDELRKMMDEELDGESLSEFVGEERRKNPY